MAALIAVGIDAIVKAPVGCDSAALSALYHYLPDAQRFDTEEDYVADRLRLKVLRSWVNTLRDKDIRKRYTCWIDYYSDDLQQKETEAATQARADAAGAALPHPPMETFAALMQRQLAAPGVWYDLNDRPLEARIAELWKTLFPPAPPDPAPAP